MGTPMAVGERTVAEPSPVRTRPRSTGPRPTFAGRWPNLSSRAVSASVLLCSCRTRLVLRSHCLCSWRHTGPSQETAAYCHFGREAYTKDGIKFFEWENAKDLSKFAPMTPAQVTAELKGSNYLTKWVD